MYYTCSVPSFYPANANVVMSAYRDRCCCCSGSDPSDTDYVAYNDNENPQFKVIAAGSPSGTSDKQAMFNGKSGQIGWCEQVITPQTYPVTSGTILQQVGPPSVPANDDDPRPTTRTLRRSKTLIFSAEYREPETMLALVAITSVHKTCFGVATT